MSTEVMNLPAGVSAPKIQPAAVVDEIRTDLEEASNPTFIYQDPAMIRLTQRLALALILALVLATVCASGFIIRGLQKPKLLVLDKTTGQTVMLNDLEMGRSPGASLGDDKLYLDNMDYLAKLYLGKLFNVDQRTRAADIGDVLRLMVPSSAVGISEYWKSKRVLSTEKAESWNATWNVEHLEHDTKNPLLIKVIGRQEIDKVVGGVGAHESKQVLVNLKLVMDAEDKDTRTARKPSNLMTGFRVFSVESKELNNGAGESGTNGAALTSINAAPPQQQ